MSGPGYVQVGARDPAHSFSYVPEEKPEEVELEAGVEEYGQGDAFFGQSQSMLAEIAPNGSVVDTVRGLQRFRKNHVKSNIKDQFKLARFLYETNWFARSVLKVQLGVFGAGFQFKGEEAKVWAGMNEEEESDDEAAEIYPWQEVAGDVWREWLTCDNVVAIWKKGTLPHVIVLDCEQVDFRVDAGVQSISVPMKKDQSLSVSSDLTSALKDQLGVEMFNALQKGSSLRIIKGGESEWDFEALIGGKRTAALARPGIVTAADDLDYIEMTKVGDWNGAWKRKDVIRQVKKGYGITSGPMGGSAKQHAKVKSLKSLSAGVTKISGAANFATNFDVEMAYHLLDSGFFGREGNITYEARRRLVLWGGFAARLLTEGFSQQRGDRGDVSQILRSEATYHRGKVEGFLKRVFNNPSFLGTHVDKRLRPEHAQSVLYTSAELETRVRAAVTHGLASPPTCREEMGYDDARESARMQDAHKRKEDYTPPFEAKQGIVADAAGVGAEPKPNTNPSQDDNPGGRG